MPKKLVSDELWSQVEPLLPKHEPTPKGGRPCIPDRASLDRNYLCSQDGDTVEKPAAGDRLRQENDLLAQTSGLAGSWCLENFHHAILQNLHGRPTCRPHKLHADKGYDFPFRRQACTVRRIKHRIARRGLDSSAHLGNHRWVIERTFAWLHRYRRLLIRYERRSDIHLVFFTLAASLITFRFC